MIYFIKYKHKIIYSQVAKGEFYNNSENVIETNLKFRAYDATRLNINDMEVIKRKNIYPDDINNYLESLDPNNYSLDKALYQKLKENENKNISNDNENYTSDLEKKINELEVQLSSEKAANQASLIGLMEISNRVRDLESKVIK